LGQLPLIILVEGFLPYLLILSFALVVCLARVLKRAEPVSVALRFDVLLGVGWTAYWLYIGGDHFQDRFLLILYPLGIYALFKYFSGRANWEVVTFVLVLIAIFQVDPPWLGDPRFHYRANKYDCWITVGKFLKEKYPGKSLATSAIGKVPFFSGAYTIDELGLIDPVIAHEPMAQKIFEPGHTKYDPDYVLSRQPDLIVEWLTGGGDLAYGLSKSKFEKAGYHISYLFSINEVPPPIRVVTVSGRDDQTIEYLRAHGYDFAVLEKR
jgi:arabinofuranosyltransferase